jgi:ribosome-binding protein aMBF1 (putative translation factor)
MAMSGGRIEVKALEREIESGRAALLDARIRLLAALDDSEARAWPKVIRVAREAGVDKETLCRELACAWSTILRWEAGHTVPGIHARRGIKARLMELLRARALDSASGRKSARRAATAAAG